MLDTIWNLLQDRDISRLRAAGGRQEEHAEGLQQQMSSLQARHLELEMRHEQLKLVTLSLWRLLEDRLGVTEAELKRYVESTDLLDGSADGKIDLARELVPCPHCRRSVLNTAVVCPHCNARQTSSRVFDHT